MSNASNGIALLSSEPGLYIIFNRCTGRLYVGQAVSRRKRCMQHLAQLRRGEHPNYKMQRDATEHGIEHFCFIPLPLLPETHVIRALRANDVEQGYNLSDGDRWTVETSFREHEARLVKKGLYLYLPAVDRTVPVHRLLLGSWASAQAAL